MKYTDRNEFEKADVFGVGSPNDGFAQYFVGNSFLKPLTVRKSTCFYGKCNF